MPPIVKIYEALGAIGDGRVRLIDERSAEVISSEGDKAYAVEISMREVSSNDNGSYWQGYLGYPGIAVLIARSMLPIEHEGTSALSGIPWKDINRRYRNDYAKTLGEVDRRLIERGSDPQLIREKCESLLEALRRFAPIRGERRRPPKSQSVRTARQLPRSSKEPPV